MIVGLDTSIVVRLLAGEPEDLALAAMRFLVGRQKVGDRFRVSDLVVAEAYFAFQHHYGASKRDSLDALRDLLSAPGMEASVEVMEILAAPDLETAKPGFLDRVIHRSYLRGGADQVVTFERAAAKLPGVSVLSP